MTFLIDLDGIPDVCCTDALEELTKAQRFGEVSHLWDASPNRFADQHIDAVSVRLGDILSAMRNMLAQFLGGHAHALMKAEVPWLRWDEARFEIVRRRLNSMNPSSMQLADYELLIEFIVQRYLPDDVINTEAQYLAVRAALLGKIQANLEVDRRVTDPMLGRLVDLLPTDFAHVPPHIFTPLEASMLDWGRAHAGEAIRSVAEAARHRMATIVLEHVQASIIGQKEGTWKYLSTRLFDQFSAQNRDMRRVAVTEVGEIQNQAYVVAKAPGQQVRRQESYRGACDWCKSIDGQVFTIVAADARGKDGATEIWPGKTNVGRSASPRMRVGNSLVERTADEMWWPAAGLQHPNCFINPSVPVYTRTGWVPISTIRVGDTVLTHEGRFRPVTWVPESFDWEGPVYNAIVSDNGRNRVRLPATTGEHPFLTDRGWVASSLLEVGDTIISLGKKCPTCDKVFVNLKFPNIHYCSVKCSPRPGTNQFSSSDPAAVGRAKAITAEANARRMQAMTVEQRAALTAAGRAVMANRGYAHLVTPESRSRLGVAASRYNYQPSPAEIAIGSGLKVLGIVPAFQHRISSAATDSKGRQRYWWVDLALPDSKIAVEIDGAPWHGRLGKDRDERKDADLLAQGWTILRFQAERAAAMPSAIAEEIARIAMNHDGSYVFGKLRVERLIVRNRWNVCLYNFAVQDDESYVAAGFVTHNCRGSWTPVTQRPPEVSEQWFAYQQALLDSV